MPRAPVMMGFRFITDYAWLLPTYPVDVGVLADRFKRTEPHESVSGPLAERRLQSLRGGVSLPPSSTTERR